MINKRPFKLEVYSTFGQFQLLVDTSASVAVRLADMKKFEIIGESNNILYVNIPNLKGKTAIIHDENFGILSQIDIQSMHYFQGPSFYPVYQKNIVYFDSPKNASTSIVSEIYNYFWKTPDQPIVTGEKEWFEIWIKLNKMKSFLLKKEDYAITKSFFSNWKKFTVYEDPIKRFLSAVNDKISGHVGIASTIPCPKLNDDISKFLDKMILAVQMQTLNSCGYDQHIVPLSLYLKDFMDDITDFVWLKDVDDFMLENMNIKPKHYHVLKEKKITSEMLTEKQLSRLKELYKDDYQIQEKYRDKFYTPKLNY